MSKQIKRLISSNIKDVTTQFKTLLTADIKKYLEDHMEEGVMNLRREINYQIRSIRHDIKNNECKNDDDMKTYENETEENRTKRALNKDQWPLDFISDDIDDNMCDNYTNCWYEIHRDRWSSFYIHRLIGTNISLCGHCLDDEETIKKVIHHDNLPELNDDDEEE